MRRRRSDHSRILLFKLSADHGVSEMNRNAARLVQFAAALLALVTMGSVLNGRAGELPQQGVPTDWTHQHVIFSRPATAAKADLLERDPRYWQQWYRQNIVRALSVNGEAAVDAPSTGARSEPASSQLSGDWSESMGSGASVGAGNYPAKYSFSTSTATCANAPSPDFVVFSTGLQSSGTVASIAAFDNLYTGCTGQVPSPYWAYNTTASAAGTIKTSPVFSLDGSQLAFVQTDGLHGTLILLKWKGGTGTLAAPATPSLVLPAAYSACTAPCMTKFDLRTSLSVQTNDTTSSVYYDYTGDVGWVGDSLGLLHQFHPFFNGTPAEITTAPWPVQVNASNHTALTSPVFDPISGNVFVGDAGGYVERVSASTGVATVSAQVDFGTGLIAAPTLDRTANKIYVYASSNGVANCSGTKTCAAVYQFSTTFAAGNSGSQTHVGVGGATNPMYAGGFDSSYVSSKTATGNLYVCGDTGADPIIYGVKISAGVMPAAGTFIGPVTTDASTAACSPVTDILNANLAGGAEERIFVSAQSNGRATACANKGCLVSFIDTPWQGKTAFVVGQEIIGAGHIQTAITSGTTGTSTPVWTGTTGKTLTDGGVTWLDQGILSQSQLGLWTKNTAYVVGVRLADTNGNVQIVTTAGTTGGTVPTWATAVGANTTDNTVTYINAGIIPTSAFQSASGASGVILDNTVAASTMAGASQIYFSTLGNQTCTTSSSTGGCAVQASQSALK